MDFIFAPQNSSAALKNQKKTEILFQVRGDYDVNDLSPINCLLLCGQKYKYAALENGGYCFCGNSLSTSGKRSDAECNKKCNGSASWPPSVQWQKCGGPSKISVYNASERIIGLSMMSYRRLNILAPEKNLRKSRQRY